MKNSNYFFKGFTISLGIIFAIFSLRQTGDVIWDIRSGMMIVIYPYLAVTCLYLVIKYKKPLTFVLFGLCSFAAYFLIKHSDMIFFSDFNFQEVVPFMFLILANASFWYGLYLLRHEQTFLHIFGDAILTAVPIFLMLFLGNYLLPKPVQHLGVMEITGFLIFCIGAMAFSAGSHALFLNGNKGLSQWIPAGIIRIMSFASLIVCLVWTNNVFYSGCYPLVAIGKECPRSTVQIPAIKDSVELTIDTADVDDSDDPSLELSEKVISH